jgi:hypothetical protein
MRPQSQPNRAMAYPGCEFGVLARFIFSYIALGTVLNSSGIWSILGCNILLSRSRYPFPERSLSRASVSSGHLMIKGRVKSRPQ